MNVKNIITNKIHRIQQNRDDPKQGPLNNKMNTLHFILIHILFTDVNKSIQNATLEKIHVKIVLVT